MWSILFFFFFFFKQKTAYEITYGDWSSDVCSSDLDDPLSAPTCVAAASWCCRIQATRSEERRVGKSVVGCVDLGGRRIIKKKKKKKKRKIDEWRKRGKGKERREID